MNKDPRLFRRLVFSRWHMRVQVCKCARICAAGVRRARQRVRALLLADARACWRAGVGMGAGFCVHACVSGRPRRRLRKLARPKFQKPRTTIVVFAMRTN
jgi:hypothetical protein